MGLAQYLAHQIAKHRTSRDPDTDLQARTDASGPVFLEQTQFIAHLALEMGGGPSWGGGVD